MHTNPNVSVLELDAGTGGAASSILSSVARGIFELHHTSSAPERTALEKTEKDLKIWNTCTDTLGSSPKIPIVAHTSSREEEGRRKSIESEINDVRQGEQLIKILAKKHG